MRHFRVTIPGTPVTFIVRGGVIAYLTRTTFTLKMDSSGSARAGHPPRSGPPIAKFQKKKSPGTPKARSLRCVWANWVK